MYESAFETYRKLSESWLAAQQEMFRKTIEQWPKTDAAGGGTAAPQSSGEAQTKTIELIVEMLSRQRESLDASYRSFIQLVEQTTRISEAKSPEQARVLVEDLWRRWFETLKTQSESQFRDIHTWTDKYLNIARSAQGAQG